MKKLFVAVGLALAFSAVAQADNFTFESPPYTLGALLGQESWYHVPETAIVTDADASEGSQSAMPEGLIATTLAATYTPTEAYRVSADIRLGGGTKGYIILGGAEGFQTSIDKVLEFGFDGGFYAHGANAYTVEGSLPDSDRWVTVWCDLYDAGSGDLMADIGWCEQNETPFVDGLRISGYDAADRDSSRLGVLTNSGAYVDDISIAVPEPSTLVLLSAVLIGLVCCVLRKPG